MTQLPIGSTIGGQEATHLGNIQTHLQSTDIISNISTETNSAISTHINDLSHIEYTSATGANAKVLTLVLTTASLVDGLGVSFKNLTQNTAAVTLDINGLGAKSILKANGSALSSGNLKANSIYTVRYNGNAFILQGGDAEYGTAEAGDVLVGTTVGRENGVVAGTLALTGNAVAADVRSGKTFYNTNAKSKLTGTFVSYGVGEYIDDSKIVPPIITPNGTDANYKPVWRGSHLYTRTAGVSSLSNYDLKGQLLNTFTPASLNGGYSVPNSIFPVPGNAYFYFSSANSYNGEIRYAYGLSSGNIGSTPVFFQSGSQNSQGGYYGVAAVAQDGGIYYYDNTSYYKRTTGLGHTTVKWQRFGNAPTNGFYPGYNIITSIAGLAGTIETIRDSDGGTAAQLRWRSDGASTGVPYSYCFDYINSILYILPGNQSTVDDLYKIKKYLINPTTGAITTSSTYDLKAFYTSVSTDQAYRYSTLAGVFGDKVAIKVANGSSSGHIGVYLIDSNLSTTPVKNTLLSSSMDKLTNVSAQDNSGELIVTPTQIYGAGLKYKVIG